MASKVIYSREAALKLDRLINKFKPDIAHAHCLYHHLSPSVLSVLRYHGIPAVLTAHDLKLGCPAYKMLTHDGICERCKNGNLLHLVKNRCLHGSLGISVLVTIESGLHKLLGLYRKNLDKIIVPSLFYQEKLSEWGWSREKLVYIPNYVCSDQFEPQYTPGDYFVYFGRLAPEKGVDTLIKASIQADVKTLIVGTGPYEGHLKSIACCSDNIKFLGRKEKEELWSIVRGARGIVLPSEWYENAPMSILEAYANGKPVIGARIGGITEMILEEETGYLFKSGNVNELAALLQQVTNQPQGLTEDMGYRGREFVETSFTAQRYFDETSALYDSLINS
jgi:glycosyltransferase involved in cell wall biosynthesis